MNPQYKLGEKERRIEREREGEREHKEQPHGGQQQIETEVAWQIVFLGTYIFKLKLAVGPETSASVWENMTKKIVDSREDYTFSQSRRRESSPNVAYGHGQRSLAA